MATALLLGMLGVVIASQGDCAQARARFAEKQTLWEQVGERSGIASALRDLGWLARREGDLKQAWACYERALGLERELGASVGIAAALAGLGDVARGQGDYMQAVAYYADGLLQFHGHEAWNERAVCLEGLAAVAWAGGDAARAARLCGAAATARLPDFTLTPLTLAECAELIAVTRATLGEEHFASAWAAGQVLSLDQAIAEALETAPVADGGVAS
jgi:tetratricopeptide (TPR) repeat protein